MSAIIDFNDHWHKLAAVLVRRCGGMALITKAEVQAAVASDHSAIIASEDGENILLTLHTKADAERLEAAGYVLLGTGPAPGKEPN